MSPLLSPDGCKKPKETFYALGSHTEVAASFEISTRPAATRKHCHGLPKEKREISDHGADSKGRETPIIRLTCKKNIILIQVPMLSQD